MNKKVLFGLFAASAMLFATACSNDELDSAMSNGNTALFKIALNAAAGTRAISDGKTVNELVWEVYDKNGTKVPGISGKEDAFTNGSKSHTLNLTLAKGQTYTIAFWVQYKDAYITDDLTRIELNYNGVAGNDECRDAFYAYTKPITVTGNIEETINLKRPFAQLNLGVSDLEAFEKAGIKLSQVEVEVSEVAGNFNIKTGEASAAVPAKFNLADVLCKEGSENPTLTLQQPLGGVSSFPWISMNYLLVNKGNVDVTYTIKTTHDDVVLTSANTPIQRNHRTNLIAKLTNVGEFTLVIDEQFGGTTNVEVGEDPEVEVYGVKAGGKYFKTLADAITAGYSDIELADCTAEDVTVVANGTGDGSNINEAIVGRGL